MSRIAVVEDDPDLRDNLVRYLDTQGGHELLPAGSLSEFWTLAPRAQLVILDVQLPDGSGIDSLPRVRVEAPRAGVIMLTARGELTDKLAGLEKGADHYFVKPFPLAELAAHIVTLERRLGLGGWRVDELRRELICPGERRLKLTDSEIDLLKALAGAPGEIIARKRLVEGLGHDWRLYDMRRLDQLVSRLRRRWLQTHHTHLPLHTEHRQGYTFADGLNVT